MSHQDVASTVAGEDDTLMRMIDSFAHSGAHEGVDVAFSFDTTGSMYGCLEQVRANIRQSCEQLISAIPNLRIAIIAHGDYCDYYSNILEKIDFTNNISELVSFVTKAKMTGGGDFPEAYELAMREARQLSWNPRHSKALCIIGDAPPHPPSMTSAGIYWRDELHTLYRDMGVKIYAIQAYDYHECTQFYQELARRSGGVHISFTQYNLFNQMFMAVCHAEAGRDSLERYKDTLRKQGGLNGNLQTIIDKIGSEMVPTGLRPVASAWWDRAGDTGATRYTIDENTLKFKPYSGPPIVRTSSTAAYEPSMGEVIASAMKSETSHLMGVGQFSTRTGTRLLDSPAHLAAEKARKQRLAEEAQATLLDRSVRTTRHKVGEYVLEKVGEGKFELVHFSKADMSKVVTPAKEADPVDPNAPPPRKLPKSGLDAAMRLTPAISRQFAIERLARDLREVQRSPLSTVNAAPLESDILEWHGNLTAPSGPYEGIVFHIKLMFLDSYPRKPPTVMLMTKLSHAHVFGNWICLDMLELGGWGGEDEQNRTFTGWSSGYSVLSVLLQLQAFLFSGAFPEKHFVEASRRAALACKCPKCGHDGANPATVHPPLLFTPRPPEESKDKEKEKEKPTAAKGTVLGKRIPAAKPIPAPATPSAPSAPPASPASSIPLPAFPSPAATGGSSTSRASSYANILASARGVQQHKAPAPAVAPSARPAAPVVAVPLQQAWRKQEVLPLESLQVGSVRVGVVRRVEIYGAFVNIGVTGVREPGAPTINMNGLVPKEEITHDHVWDAADVVQVGQHVRVKVVSVDRALCRIGLSMKALVPAKTRAPAPLPAATATMDSQEVAPRSGGAAGSLFSCLDVPTMYQIFKYLSPVDLNIVGRTCRSLRSVTQDGMSYLWERQELVCFHSKRPFTEDVLGVGLNLENKLNGKLAYITTTFDLISYKSFMSEKVRKAAYKEPFTHWLPLFICKEHGARAMPLAKEAMAKICADCYGDFEPWMVLEVIPKLMNTFVVQAMSGRLYASVMALEGYQAFHHLLLMFLEEYPELYDQVNQVIESFMDDRSSRHKRKVPALGEWIPLLSVTDKYTWKDVAIPYLTEMFDRNVLWTVKKYPELAVWQQGDKWQDLPDAGKADRLRKTFEATHVSNHLCMFHVYFLDNVARPPGVSLSKVKELLHSRYGKPTWAMKDRLMREVKAMLKVDTWAGFFQYVHMPVPSDRALERWLWFANKNSIRKRYHNPAEFYASLA
eukprot:TRINITY_DN2277_c1_g1_i8.p1 TRINITY_DN2277_c1_g1~~TRINITY_DN2277_c1_g1_i8.p1  ORF type:complete len:1241 (-),score=385.36 TRINITY_DN2277_c1_g1_i8:37-3759(-)